MRPGADRSLIALSGCVGAAALVGQSALVRELMVSFYGTELALAAALCCWLAFIAVGALAGAAVARRWAGRGAALAHVAVFAVALGLPVGLCAAVLVRPITGAQPGEFLSLGAMAVGAALASFGVALPVGVFFPLAAAEEEVLTGRPAEGIGRLYVAEALGSAAAGAALSLYLLGRLRPAELAGGTSVSLLLVAALRAGGGSQGLCAAAGLLLGGLLVLAGARQEGSLFFATAALLAGGAYAMRVSAGRRDRARMSAATAFLVAALVVCVVFLGWGRRLHDALIRARWATFTPFELTDSLDTRYQNVGLGRREGDCVLVQNGRQTAQFPDQAAVSQRAALLLTQHPHPYRVLVIGGGLGGLCQQLLRGPIAALDYVEADPQLLWFVAEHLPADLVQPLMDPRFAAYAQDGRRFVQVLARDPSAAAEGRLPLGAPMFDGPPRRTPAGRYDLVVVNLGDPTSASTSRFCTVEFCREVSRILSPGGAVAFCGITGAENYVAGGSVFDYTVCLYKTLRVVFPHVVVRPGDEFCYFASAQPGVVSAAPDLLAARFDALGLEPRVLRQGFRLAEFPPQRAQWVNGLMESGAPQAQANTDSRPVAFMLFLGVQAHYVRPGPGGSRLVSAGPATGPLGSVRRGAYGGVWLLLAACPALLLALRLVGTRGRATLWACWLVVFTTGLFGMSAEMLIVYGYQTLFGYVYRDIGVIVGLFMLGLALGGWLTSRHVRSRPVTWLLIAEAAQAVLALMLPAAAALLSFSPYAFMLLSLAAGFLTGAEFPLAARLSLGAGGRSGTVAGALSACDHLGALAGAAAAGLLLVPVLGVAHTAALLAVAKCAGILALVAAVAQFRSGAGRRALSAT